MNAVFKTDASLAPNFLAHQAYDQAVADTRDVSGLRRTPTPGNAGEGGMLASLSKTASDRTLVLCACGKSAKRIAN
jgi:hypothetical protein